MIRKVLGNPYYNYKMIISGLDEAGRGAVLGPMVLCLVSFRQEDAYQLPSWGIKDSKALSPQKRKKLFNLLALRAYQVLFRIISPQEIDGNSLSELFIRHAQAMARLAPQGKLFFDAPVPPPGIPKLVKKLQEAHSHLIVQGANHGEDLFPSVAAASILAKVLRDKTIEELNQAYGPLGSGYPSDPKTRTWLKDHYQKAIDAGIVRTKWRLKPFT